GNSNLVIDRLNTFDASYCALDLVFLGRIVDNTEERRFTVHHRYGNSQSRQSWVVAELLINSSLHSRIIRPSRCRTTRRWRGRRRLTVNDQDRKSTRLNS